MVVARLWLPAVLSEEKGMVVLVAEVEGGGGGKICVLSATGLDVGWEREDG